MRNKIVSVVLASALALSFSACGEDSSEPTATVTVTASPEPSETLSEAPSLGTVSDAEFAKVVRDNTDSFDLSPDADIVGAAQSACDFLDEGATADEVFEVIVDSGVDAFDGGFLVGAGVEVYCPEYSSVFEGYTPSLNS